MQKAEAKQQYDRTAKRLPALAVGQTVRIQPVKHQEKWKKATIVKKVSDRSYLVKTANGKIYRRNWKHLRHILSPQKRMQKMNS